MKFKQLQALKKRAYEAFAEGKRLDVPESDAARLDSINLAFVGDAYYALTLRKRLVETGIPQVQVLHGLLVMAGQEERLAEIMEQIYEETKAYCSQTRGGKE